MGTQANVRRRLAIGVAGALLMSALVGNIAPVAADADQDAPTTQDRDVNVGKEATGMAKEGQYTITEVAAPAITVGTQQVAPDLGVPLSDNGRDDRD